MSLAVLVAGLGAGAASATEAADGSCPAAFPVDEVVKDMPARGLTVEHGTAPEQFTATIVGTLKDGIAPGVDMIIADVESPAVERAGGIWQGMSGSPVYAEDGRLIGAVAYGLSDSPSKVAGIVPAAEMTALMSRGVGDAATSSGAALTPTMKQQVVSSGAATSAEASSGMRQLPLPVGISGVGAKRSGALAARLAEQSSGARVFTSGATGTTGAGGSAADIVPGGNFAAAISYGDITAVGIGTTTMVCDGKAVAFGHPFLYSGASTMSVHTADALYVQTGASAPFKVANPGGAVGRLDQDRLAGIRGVLGPAPTPTPITSTITGPDGRTRSGTTQVNLAGYTPHIAAGHVVANIDRVLDQIGSGTATLRWTINGTRADGRPFSLSTTNRFASSDDIAYESVYGLFDQLASLTYNDFEDVRITGVSVTGTVEDTYTHYSLKSVSARKGDGTYATLSTSKAFTAGTGSRLHLRVTLTSYKAIAPDRIIDFAVPVPAGETGAQGELRVSGGADQYGGYYGEGEEEAGPASFDELLADLGAVTPADSVGAELNLSRETETDFVETRTTARAGTDQVVYGENYFPIRVVAAEKSKPGVVDGGTWKLRSTLSKGPATQTFSYGLGSGRPVMGDWDGNGTRTAAMFRDGTWYLKSDTSTKTATKVIFGQAGDLPVAGDWDGDGKDSIGVYRKGRWLLRDSLTAGPADRDFTFGSASAVPVAGDWNGDGKDTIGTFANGSWTVRNQNSSGGAAASFTYGKAGDVPVVGDWEGDGRDEPGAYRAGTWYVRTGLTTGATTTFAYGGKTSRPVVWD